MTIHESSCLKLGSGYGPAACIPAASVPATPLSGLASAIVAALKLTTSMPELLRKFLREIVPLQSATNASTCFGTIVKVVMLRLPRSGPGSCHRCRGSPDGRVNAVIRHAAAQNPDHPLPDLGIGRIRMAVQQHLGIHDLPVLAEAALWHLLVNPGSLHWVKRVCFGQSFERGDLTSNGGAGGNAGPYRRAVHDDRARSALAEAAAKSRTLQA